MEKSSNIYKFIHFLGDSEIFGQPDPCPNGGFRGDVLKVGYLLGRRASNSSQKGQPAAGNPAFISACLLHIYDESINYHFTF